jgi:hypothetical protein
MGWGFRVFKREIGEERDGLSFKRIQLPSFNSFLISTGDGGLLGEIGFWRLNLECLMVRLEVIGCGLIDLVKR